METPQATTTLVLIAPVSGPMLPLEEVPDPVFAGKMVGDGISIDPVTSTLLAPCDAEVLSVHPSGHAVTLRTQGGVELILHIGIDTVRLRGEGFVPLKKKGDFVRTGEPLVNFAADYIARHAPSLLTQMVVATPDRVASLTKHSGHVQAGHDIVLEALITGGSSAVEGGTGLTLSSRELLVRNPTGLHARPAAVLASTARQYRADVRVRRGSDEASAQSVTALMALEIACGDRVVLSASGADAQAAIDTLVPLIESGLGEHAEAAPADRDSAAGDRGIDDGSQPLTWSPGTRIFKGVAASPGIATGGVFSLGREDAPAMQPAGTPAEERRMLDEALARAREQLQALSEPAAGSAVQSGIFRAHLELLEDPALVGASRELIASGAGAAVSWQRAFTRLADGMAGARHDMFAQRADDIRDVGRRVLRLLAGDEEGTVAYPEDSIVVARDLSPSETAAFDRLRVRGFCTVTGGKTSHVAILARSLGIPAITGIDPRVAELQAGARVILDGTSGVLVAEPSAGDFAVAAAEAERLARRGRAAAETAQQPAITTDGVHIEVAANIGTVADATDAALAGADGIGLLRSEFLFLDRPAAPDEDEQYEAYSAAARAFGGGARIVIRTLDVGGDKPLAYLPLPREENPFLGVRGIRIATERADLLRTQLRAIVRAARSGGIHVMFPMVTTLDDWRLGKRLLEGARAEIGGPPIPTGIMVEVPSVALIAGLFAAEADFFSIGTNDLTQYTLAMDRGHPALASQVDALHPSVLRLIEMTARAARARGRWVGVCGGLAGEEAAVPILLGLGVDELSVSIPVVPSIKARIRALGVAACRTLAARALAAGSAAEVREIVGSVRL